ncbi:UDP-N-acetylglucosamine 2-epimerase (non-hydrolyzing) [Stieleria sp. ICT_E10.1]|uniref:non-hydrolyzing UDP-N-acetylglucosamine 2-epimerase n=1 Tax=Stieleria sedimenti TaxID=2976331 RepID=UPI0021801D9F|nr:UDP-N-acetylglucosamine 2-epimerase (non-hydrolyzing) [Stieleria sedimenti]MCS7469424.1 UDP-N-acetylglucosamine 2-epimerase (non-hydrolyzing) [Stieleria sedimenti]
MKRLKISTILGTRPEIIRLACVISALDEATEQRIVHTGQNYDYELNQVFFENLGIRKPDHFMNVDTSSLGAVLGGILTATESELLANRPDAVVILGDTNSALSAIIAKRMGIPIYHMEAGNRCFDANVPEETNRRIVDHISHFNLVYTEHARRHLIAEGISQRHIYVTGSPMNEVLTKYRDPIDESTALDQLSLTPRGYILVSMHREENVDSERPLSQLVQALDLLAEHFDVPVIVSTHPRTRKRIDGFGIQAGDRVQFMKPFGFFDYVQLQKQAKCVVSDSGTISEESSILNFPAVTIRNAIERPEALDTGSIVMTGTCPEHILRCVDLAVREFEAGQFPPVPADYRVGNCSQRVVRFIHSTVNLAHRWYGIESPH